jgi:hypothetical protein
MGGRCDRFRQQDARRGGRSRPLPDPACAAVRGGPRCPVAAGALDETKLAHRVTSKRPPASSGPSCSTASTTFCPTTPSAATACSPPPAAPSAPPSPARASPFALDRRLSKKAPERTRKLVDELRPIDLDDGGSMRARNLAASAFEFVIGEVRAAARYLFADEPRVLAPFLSRYEPLRKARARSRRKKGPAGAAPLARRRLTTVAPPSLREGPKANACDPTEGRPSRTKKPAGQADGRAGQADGRAGQGNGRAGQGNGRAGQGNGRAGRPARIFSCPARPSPRPARPLMRPARLSPSHAQASRARWLPRHLIPP